MNRIVQSSFPPESIIGLDALHERLIRALGNHVPPSVAALYATPRLSTQSEVQFLSAYAGQPIAYSDLSTQAAQRLAESLFERLRAIKQFAMSYASQASHDPAVLQMLHDASAEPALEAIYSVGGQPVLLFWDKAIPTRERRRTLAAPIIPVAAPLLVASSRWRWWLAALFLFLLLLGIIWWLWCPRSPLNRVEPPAVIIMPDVGIEPPVVSEPSVPVKAPEPVFDIKPEDLPIIDPEPEPEPLPEPLPEPVKVEPPKPPPPPPPPAPKPKPVVKPPVTISSAKNLCPEDRPAALAPEMIVVFDASGSMMININASRQEEQWAFSVMNRGALALQWLSPQDRQRLEQLLRQPTRMVTAQQATINVLQRLPSDVSTGLVVVDECPTARNLGRYAPSQRGQIINQLRGLSPRQGTPLADGILEAGRLADGVNKESTILLVSDGGESCGGDPCMVARNLARQKPHLKINVVDIGGTGAAACIAEATGGRVYPVSSIAEVSRGIDRAAQDALGPSTCKK